MISLSFSGCELLEEEEDYITVVVVADILVGLVDNKGECVVTDIVEGVPIQITMTKAGGERTILGRGETNAIGGVDGATGTFKVYGEQPVECFAVALCSYKDYAPWHQSMTHSAGNRLRLPLISEGPTPGRFLYLSS